MNTTGRRRLLTLLAAVAGLCAHPAAARQERDPQAPVFRSGVDLVVVDVAVLDPDGFPVRGLLPTDFAVTVDDQPRRVATAEFVDVAAELDFGSDTAPISTNEGAGVGRQFVFVVDTSSMEAGDLRRATDAASRLFARLSFADRSALRALPVGRAVAFTWRHDRVLAALQETTASGPAAMGWEHGSLSEARDIATRGDMALRNIAERACAAGNAPAVPAGNSNQQGQGQGAPPGAPTTPTVGLGGGSSEACMHDVQANAQTAWSLARTNSLSSATALRQLLSALREIGGDKTVVLISGGWPLEENEQTSVLSSVAEEAAAARATVMTVFVPRALITADRRAMSPTPLSDRDLHLWPLERLANMTGGESFRVEGAPETAFERLGRQLAGYYRVGIERNTTDVNAGERRLKVQVPGHKVTVRARALLDTAPLGDRNWSARLESALSSPVPATAVRVRVTSYVGSDPEDAGFVRIALAGEASRMQSGDAFMQLVVRDLDGQTVSTGHRRLGAHEGETVPFAANVRVPPGVYVVRLGVSDGTGRVGSVDHRVDARSVPFGALSVTGPILVNVPAAQTTAPYFDVNGIKPGERLAVQVDLAGSAEPIESAGVMFEIAASPTGKALIEQPAVLVAVHGRSDAVLAQAVADVRTLPPGDYVLRVNVRSGEATTGQLLRTFTVLEPVLR